MQCGSGARRRRTADRPALRFGIHLLLQGTGRTRGLGTCLTTLHLKYAAEAAELLGIPDGVHQVALLPVAYTLGTDFKRAKRNPMEDVVHWERWSA